MPRQNPARAGLRAAHSVQRSFINSYTVGFFCLKACGAGFFVEIIFFCEKLDCRILFGIQENPLGADSVTVGSPDANQSRFSACGGMP